MTIVLFLVGVGLRVPTISAQATQQPIPATRAFDAPGCSASDLSNNTDLARGNPEWKAIIIDPRFPLPNNPPTILEGIVPPPSEQETSTDQAHAEVSEEELPWNHYTHDFTFKVVPDPRYFGLLSSWVNTDGTIGVHGDMEVEWENASLMDEQPEGFQRIWGAAPEFVWPAVGDRVWVEGRWIFDCGHPSSSDTDHVQYSTEIHPPRALVTFRLNHPALDSFPISRGSAPNFPAPQSYLPVTGVPATPLGTGPTNVPVTEADIFVTGNSSNSVAELSPAGKVLNLATGGGLHLPMPGGSRSTGGTVHNCLSSPLRGFSFVRYRTDSYKILEHPSERAFRFSVHLQCSFSLTTSRISRPLILRRRKSGWTRKTCRILESGQRVKCWRRCQTCSTKVFALASMTKRVSRFRTCL